jgi:hypothetical protein
MLITKAGCFMRAFEGVLALPLIISGALGLSVNKLHFW